MVVRLGMVGEKERQREFGGTTDQQHIFRGPPKLKVHDICILDAYIIERSH